MLPTSGALANLRKQADIKNHSAQNVYQQDVICTAMGCQDDIDKAYYPSMVCGFHARKIYMSFKYNIDYQMGIAREAAAQLMDEASERTSTRPPRQPVVYYMRFGEGIKIGTTINVEARAKQLAIPLTSVLATEPGHFDLEKKRHQFFADTRIPHTEVFRESPKLWKHIEAVIRYHGEPQLSYAA